MVYVPPFLQRQQGRTVSWPTRYRPRRVSPRITLSRLLPCLPPRLIEWFPPTPRHLHLHIVAALTTSVVDFPPAADARDRALCPPPNIASPLLLSAQPGLLPLRVSPRGSLPRRDGVAGASPCAVTPPVAPVPAAPPLPAHGESPSMLAADDRGPLPFRRYGDNRGLYL